MCFNADLVLLQIMAKQQLLFTNIEKLGTHLAIASADNCMIVHEGLSRIKSLETQTTLLTTALQKEERNHSICILRSNAEISTLNEQVSRLVSLQTQHELKIKELKDLNIVLMGKLKQFQEDMKAVSCKCQALDENCEHLISLIEQVKVSGQGDSSQQQEQ